MAADANTGLAEAEATLAAHGRRLAAALVDAVPGWIERITVERARLWFGETPGAVRAAAAEAGRAAGEDAAALVPSLLSTDIDEQRANPLALVRRLVPHASRVLDEAGVPPIERDEFDQRIHPDDRHGLAPATWSDIDPALHEPGLAWSAAKAFVHKARRRAEGFT